jgi:hypothetical protein
VAWNETFARRALDHVSDARLGESEPREDIIRGFQQSALSLRAALPPPRSVGWLARAARHQAPHCLTGTAWLAAAPSCYGVHMPRSLSCLERLDKLGQYLTDIADDAQVGNREYRGLWVLVDGNDVPSGLHPDDVLDGA